MYHCACFNNDDKSRVPPPRRRNIRDSAIVVFCRRDYWTPRSLDVTSMKRSRLCSRMAMRVMNQRNPPAYDLMPPIENSTIGERILKSYL